MKRLICALVIGCMSLHASATWTLNGNTATDGEFTFKVQSASTGVIGEMTMFDVKKASDTPCELDLTTFKDDTGKKIVETMALGNSLANGLGNILSVTGFIGPDVTIIGQGSLGNQRSGNQSQMKRIHVSENLTTIGSSAMAYLHQLDDFFPTDMKKLTTCGSSAFDQTSIKGDIRLPELETLPGIFCRIYKGTAGITSVYAPKLKSLGERAFTSQKLMTNIVISSEATLINDYAFNGCLELESFEPRTLPDLTKIGTAAFNNCPKLAGGISAPSCTVIGNQAFQDCPLFNELEVSPDLTSVGSYAFWKCPQFTNFTPRVFAKFTGTLGDYVFGGDGAATATKITGDFDFGGATSVGTFAFAYTSISSIRCTNAVSVGTKAFRDCRSMTNAVFSSALKSIDAQAFANCVKLESFEPFLPADMTLLGYCAFGDCKKLADPLLLNSPDLAFKGQSFSGCSLLSNITIKAYIKDFQGNTFNQIADGASFYWYVDAPQTITQPICGGATHGYRFYVNYGKTNATWLNWTTDATFGKPIDKRDPGYPGRHTFGCLQDTAYASAAKMWLVDWPPKGLMLLVR